MVRNYNVFISPLYEICNVGVLILVKGSQHCLFLNLHLKERNAVTRIFH